MRRRARADYPQSTGLVIAARHIIVDAEFAGLMAAELGCSHSGGVACGFSLAELQGRAGRPQPATHACLSVRRMCICGLGRMGVAGHKLPTAAGFSAAAVFQTALTASVFSCNFCRPLYVHFFRDSGDWFIVILVFVLSGHACGCFCAAHAGRALRIASLPKFACRSCGYDVRYVTSPRCPECGAVQDAPVDQRASDASSARTDQEMLPQARSPKK